MLPRARRARSLLQRSWRRRRFVETCGCASPARGTFGAHRAALRDCTALRLSELAQLAETPRGPAELKRGLGAEAGQREEVVCPFALRPCADVGRIGVDHANDCRSLKCLVADVDQRARTHEGDEL